MDSAVVGAPLRLGMARPHHSGHGAGVQAVAPLVGSSRGVDSHCRQPPQRGEAHILHPVPWLLPGKTPAPRLIAEECCAQTVRSGADARLPWQQAPHPRQEGRGHTTGARFPVDGVRARPVPPDPGIPCNLQPGFGPASADRRHQRPSHAAAPDGCWPRALSRGEAGPGSASVLGGGSVAA